MKLLLAVLLLFTLRTNAQNVQYYSSGVTTETPQPKQEKCSTHTRGFFNGHWLSSDMCPDDYQTWLNSRYFPPVYKDKQFWAGEVVIGAAVALDAASTSRNIALGYVETNRLLGPHPSNGKLVGFGIGAASLYTGLNYVSWRLSHKDPSTAWRAFGHWAIPAVVGSMHGYYAYHNYSK